MGQRSTNKNMGYKLYELKSSCTVLLGRKYFLTNDITFFPQGLVMSFYGLLGFLFSNYLWLTIIWSIGGGFNEFNKQKNLIRIFRWGFPGKNRKIDLLYNIKDVEAIRVEFVEGLNPKRTIYLIIKKNKEIPLTRIGQPLSLEEIETQAADIAKFLQVDLI
uniref:Photosystem I assembly protein Ycf4 n=1 Tax=Acetabularia peniculus TaxID=35862 RepID=A0A386JLV1_ACEPE|nr:photosystem I assembly protein Ycf4 [Acetabularia peniculus]